MTWLEIDIAGLQAQPTLAIQFLELWQPLKQSILDSLPVPAKDWGMAYALAIQSLIDQAKEVLSPSLAGLIVMECAIPMSKVNLKN